MAYHLIEMATVAVIVSDSWIFLLIVGFLGIVELKGVLLLNTCLFQLFYM